ncbi:hypothetical protein AEST_02780 [Alishewanella aestuarii B11]|uniref:RHS repeat-associated core domain-containing protein n=1 Tax=Alishewanella aestuarii B11 TaxID=1197174 RepID=J2IHK6_9ALTE|nr:RHS repeat-associated core domain-containing protein [Alishewanella aestuarii]EJI86732.1 hypothetical protein AEST_02780 [Alishewanella aestuarii B11]
MSFDVFGARRDAQSWAIKHTEASSGLLSSALTLRWAPRFCNPATLLATALAPSVARAFAGGKIRNLPLFPAHYTGHEQSDDVGLVHMGGRVYDPILGRFLQADPFVQQPNNTPNLNRYSYVLNNLLNATDPSGYFFQMLAMWAVQYIAAARATSAISYAMQRLKK